MQTEEKDAAEKDSYGFDFSDLVPSGDTLSASSWTSDVGVTLTSPSFSATTSITTIWIEGGVPGGQYLLRNFVTTTQGRKFERQFLLSVTDDA